MNLQLMSFSEFSKNSSKYLVQRIRVKTKDNLISKLFRDLHSNLKLDEKLPLSGEEAIEEYFTKYKDVLEDEYKLYQTLLKAELVMVDECEEPPTIKVIDKNFMENLLFTGEVPKDVFYESKKVEEIYYKYNKCITNTYCTYAGVNFSTMESYLKEYNKLTREELDIFKAFANLASGTFDMGDIDKLLD